MSEYDLVCDGCGQPLEPSGAVVSWTREEDGERAHALTHPDHVPDAATDRVAGRELASPNGYLRFVSARLGARIDDPAPLRDILWALAPFVMRPDNPAEMDEMRAASFGATVGVKPGERPTTSSPRGQPPQDAGK